MEEIVQALEQDGSDWAKNTVETLRHMSPTSLKITLKEMNLGKNLDLHECLRMEYRLAVNCMANKDLYEGNFRIKRFCVIPGPSNWFETSEWGNIFRN